MLDYWQKQTPDKPLFPDIEWNKPERKDQAGKLAIIGGNKLSLVAVAESYQTAQKMQVGEIRVLLPDALQKTIPAAMTDVIFADTNYAGGLSNKAAQPTNELVNWADVVLFIGDAGKNSQTAILYESILEKIDKKTIITRDAIDLINNDFTTLLNNPNLTFVASFSQIQKMFQSIFYPKILTFSMQLSQFIEALHKFSLTYPIAIVTFHDQQIIVAQNGKVVSQYWNQPLQIWRGNTATIAASYLLWSPNQPFEALATSITH